MSIIAEISKFLKFWSSFIFSQTSFSSGYSCKKTTSSYNSDTMLRIVFTTISHIPECLSGIPESGSTEDQKELFPVIILFAALQISVMLPRCNTSSMYISCSYVIALRTFGICASFGSNSLIESSSS